MENIYFIISSFIAGILGIKNRKLGLIVGIATLCVFYYLTQQFSIKSLLITLSIGVVTCGASVFLLNWMFSGFKGGNHNTGPSYLPGAGGGRAGAPPGGIIQSDEERERNRKK